MREADRHSVERDLREHRIEPLDAAVGVPVDRYLIDAMRRLLHDGRWRVNVPSARVWRLRDAGLHLVWPAAARDITELLAADRVPGIPRDPDTLAELLLERGLAVPRVDALGRHPTWRLAPAPLAAGRDTPVALTLLRLKEPAMLFPFGAPAPVDVAPVGQGGASPRSELVLPTVPADSQGAPASPPSPADTSPAPSEPDGDADGNGGEDIEAGDAHAALGDEARRWLTESSKSTARLLDHLAALQAALDDAATFRDGLLWLRYPDWFETAAWPAAEAAQSLSDGGLLEPDPRTPMRRFRDHAGYRWLVLNAAVSRRLQVLLDGNHPVPLGGAPVFGPDDQATTRHPPAPAGPDRDAADATPTNLIETIIQDLIARHGGDGTRTRVLDHATRKALARQHRLGVYSLRERLLTDSRVRKDAMKRLVVTL